MDGGDVVWVVMMIIWFVSQVIQTINKNKKKSVAPPVPQADAPAPPAPVRSPRASAETSVGKGLVVNLDELTAEIDETLPELEERVRAQVSFLVDRGYRDEIGSLRQALENESSPDGAAATQRARGLLSYYRGLLHTGRIHSGLRQQRELVGPHIVADRAVAEFDQPRTVAQLLPPPVAIVRDLAERDPLRESALADATLFVPRTVLQDPSHWSFLAPELARYLSTSAPSLYQDIHEGLALDVTEAEVGSDPESLTRVLYGSWIGRIVADVTGALFFGPAYLQSIAQLYAQPAAPARVTSIYLNQDGSVHGEPPAHMRVHITARWLTRMGYASEASRIRRAWDERHGSPEVVGFWGSMTSLPMEPVLSVSSQLTDALFQLPMEALGNARLAHVPGLSDWQSSARQSAAAKDALLAGARAAGSARALLAAAIEAALEAPNEAAAIQRALADSLGTASGVPERPTRASASKTTRATPYRISAPAGSPFSDLTGHDVAEALLLSDILLEPRSR